MSILRKQSKIVEGGLMNYAKVHHIKNKENYVRGCLSRGRTKKLNHIIQNRRWMKHSKPVTTLSLKRGLTKYSEIYKIGNNYVDDCLRRGAHIKHIKNKGRDKYDESLVAGTYCYIAMFDTIAHMLYMSGYPGGFAISIIIAPLLGSMWPITIPLELLVVCSIK